MKIPYNLSVNNRFNLTKNVCKRFSSELLLPLKPINVLVTGAAGQIGYSLLPRIAKGDAFGKKVPVNIKMLDLPKMESVMHGIRMELEDCAFNCLQDIEIHTDPKKAYKDTDVIVMLANSMMLKVDMTRAELLKENLRVYKETAHYLKDSCHDHLKILVVANPANTNALLLIESLKGMIEPHNITALTRLDHNRTKSMVSHMIGVNINDIRKVIVWGNHSSTMYPDLRFTEVRTPSGWKNLSEFLPESKWTNPDFVNTLRQRFSAITAARGNTSAFSAANAAVDHLKNWLVGTELDDWVSMGVYSESKYKDIPDKIVFGQPCVCNHGVYHIVTGLEINELTRKSIISSAEELIIERKTVLC